MKQELTAKEEEAMNIFWQHGPQFVKEMIAFYDDPKPHINTLSTVVRTLEEKGYVSHKSIGTSYQYYAVVSDEQYHKRTLTSVISRYFRGSYVNAISALVNEEKVSVEELLGITGYRNIVIPEYRNNGITPLEPFKPLLTSLNPSNPS